MQLAMTMTPLERQKVKSNSYFIHQIYFKIIFGEFISSLKK